MKKRIKDGLIILALSLVLYCAVDSLPIHNFFVLLFKIPIIGVFFSFAFFRDKEHLCVTVITSLVASFLFLVLSTLLQNIIMILLVSIFGPLLTGSLLSLISLFILFIPILISYLILFLITYLGSTVIHKYIPTKHFGEMTSLGRRSLYGVLILIVIIHFAETTLFTLLVFSIINRHSDNLFMLMTTNLPDDTWIQLILYFVFIFVAEVLCETKYENK